MLSLPPSVRIFLARGNTDMRKQIDSLAGLVAHVLEEDPMSGHLFVFCNRARSHLKILYWEEGGYWLLQKRLERGRFAWPDADTPALQLSATELHALLGGLDFRQAKRLPRIAKISKPPEPPAAFAS
ncbi:MAG: IS66 family insertion sequence element accessory protein TnpB [Planctomycetes bacterium]|nr:IS66 family insertion sequence element accessory protein TnpB [Planctomycetota bacterium]